MVRFLMAAVVREVITAASPVDELKWLIGDAGGLHGLLPKMWTKKNAPKIAPGAHIKKRVLHLIPARNGCYR